MVERNVASFLELLFKWNRAYRLTAFESPEEARALGVEPSLAAEPLLPQGARVLDVGSGGGFPAVPLALARPDLAFTLTEPSLSKAAFLREAAIQFGLNMSVCAQPVENRLRNSDERWEAVTIRGVHLRKGLFKALAGALVPGGVLIVWSAGDRADQYEGWMRDLGMDARRDPLPGGPLFLIWGRVPRGTSHGT